MAANAQDDEFDEFDKPGAERSRRRRGEDDEDIESDLERDLLEEDWLTVKKNPSELSDEELNDDLLQSDEEDQNASGPGTTISLNATLDLSSFNQGEGGLDEAHYAEDDYEVGEEQEGYIQAEDEYEAEGYGGDEVDDGLAGEGMGYAEEQNEDEGIYQDEVLDIGINEPLDDEFQVEDYPAEYSSEQLQDEEQADQQEVPDEEAEPEEEGDGQDGSQVTESELEPEPEVEEEMREESDEEEEDDEESGRIRFKTERKDVTVVRLSDATSKRRNIPETLELSEEAKADLLEFEEKERQRRQGRFGGGRGGGGGMGGRGGRGGRGGGIGGGGGVRGGRGGFPAMFGMGDFRGDGGGRGRLNDQRPPLMPVNMGLQQSRMPPPHLNQHQSRVSGPRGGRGGPGLFPEPMALLPQQALQPLIPPHLTHRSSPSHSAPLRGQLELHPPRLLSPPPPQHSHHPHHQQQQQQHQHQQPKNIHINPHFRGPGSSHSQAPLMPPAQNQPRPNVGPQRFPGLSEFQQHLPGSFGQAQRPLHPQDSWRGPQPPHQDREPFFLNEPRFPGQHAFDQPGPAPLMNNSSHPGQGPMSFPHQGGLGGPGFNPLGLGPAQGQGALGGVFQREPPRPNLPPQHGGPPGPSGPRPFLGPRQPFPPQQGPPFGPQHMGFGMQGIMQPQHQDPPLSHQPLNQPQRQDLPLQGPPHPHPHPLQHQQQQHQHHLGDQHPIMHLGQPPFRQPLHGSPRQMLPRPQNAQQRNSPIRPRMQIPPQRNSNLRELPIAPGNNMNSGRPTVPGGQVRPVTRSMQGMRPGQNAAPGGRAPPAGRGQSMARTPAQPGGPREKREAPPTPAPSAPSTASQDPEEDEETRLYRLKIEEQKKLREEILKRKELRRQMQAGVRKRELLDRISSQTPSQTQQQQQQPPPTAQPQQVPSLAPNGASQSPATPCQNVKTRLQANKLQAQASGRPGPQPQGAGPESGKPAQWQQNQQNQQLQQQRRGMHQQNPPRQGQHLHNPQALVEGQDPGQQQAAGLKPGSKRTVMQRANSQGSPQIPQKVRVVKLLAGVPDSSAPLPPQQQIGQPTPQQRLGPIRKVTMGTGGTQQGQQQKQGHNLQPPQQGGRGMTNQSNRVVVPGRGRGRGGQIGRGGRGMPGGPNPRAADAQPTTVCIEGLSSSTTEKQLMNLLNSIGPIRGFEMLPQQRKAIASFVSPQHALSFQHSFHRHMIDLSHIDVSIMDG